MSGSQRKHIIVCDAEPMVKNTWDTVAYPLLERATEHFSLTDDCLWVQDLKDSALNTVDDDLIQRELKHLENDGYLTLDSRGDSVASITGVTPKAKRAAGAWPNDATVGAAVMEALGSMAEKEVQPGRKKALQKTVSTLSEIGVSGAGQFFGAALRQAAGL